MEMPKELLVALNGSDVAASSVAKKFIADSEIIDISVNLVKSMTIMSIFTVRSGIAENRNLKIEGSRELIQRLCGKGIDEDIVQYALYRDKAPSICTIWATSGNEYIGAVLSIR
jgi:hypothetical protein